MPATLVVGAPAMLAARSWRQQAGAAPPAAAPLQPRRRQQARHLRQQRKVQAAATTALAPSTVAQTAKLSRKVRQCAAAAGSRAHVQQALPLTRACSQLVAHRCIRMCSPLLQVERAQQTVMDAIADVQGRGKGGMTPEQQVPGGLGLAAAALVAVAQLVLPLLLPGFQWKNHQRFPHSLCLPLPPCRPRSMQRWQCWKQMAAWEHPPIPPCSTAAGACCSPRAPAPPRPSSAPSRRWKASRVSLQACIGGLCGQRIPAALLPAGWCHCLVVRPGTGAQQCCLPAFQALTKLLCVMHIPLPQSTRTLTSLWSSRACARLSTLARGEGCFPAGGGAAFSLHRTVACSGCAAALQCRH